jgi:hypothetical protein
MATTIPPVQQLGKGPTGPAVTPSFVFPSNPPESPTIPSVAQLGKGPFNVDPNAGRPV